MKWLLEMEKLWDNAKIVAVKNWIGGWMNQKEVFSAFDIVFSIQGLVESTFNTGLQ